MKIIKGKIRGPNISLKILAGRKLKGIAGVVKGSVKGAHHVLHFSGPTVRCTCPCLDISRERGKGREGRLTHLATAQVQVGAETIFIRSSH